MTADKTSQSQKKAARAWEERNKEKTRLDSYKRTANLFVRRATVDYIQQLKDLRAAIDQKLNELENQ